MADELLPYYEKELAFIRQMGAAFAEEHPKIASRLGINADTIEDPHVSRLIEAFAYLNARIQHKLDDDFPELSDAMLSVLFPHYQRPIPSLSIAHFEADREQLSSKYVINKDTLLETDSFKGENCRFTTTYPTELYPIQVDSVNLIGRPFSTPGAAKVKGAKGVLKLSLSTFSEKITFADLKPEKLRFYLKGQSQHIIPLYQLLLNDCHKIAISSAEMNEPIFLNKNAIQAVGFKQNEGLLPYPAASFLGYRLLTEYFIFPEKFMFIDFTGLAQSLPDDVTNQLDIYIYLGSSNIELEHNISEEMFILGCTPVINLFPQRADPIKLDHMNTEYQVIPESRRPLGYEVYSIDKVTASSSSGDQECLPMYGIEHKHMDEDSHAFWFASRRAAKMNIDNRDEGTDVFLSLVDLQFNPNIPEDRTLIVETMCSNRDLPERLPFSNTQPKLQCVDSAPPCSIIRCLTQPTSTVRPPLRNHARWRLLSHLNLNHLSITGGEEATRALKEILRLYDFRGSSATRALIDSILSVQAHPISAPLTIDGRAAMCKGMEIEITLDDNQLSGSSSFLYASILEHFFSLYCSINSFTRVLVKLKNKEGYLKKCPPRAGEKAFL